jgi:uncharacterized protein YdeI (BOF family)
VLKQLPDILQTKESFERDQINMEGLIVEKTRAERYTIGDTSIIFSLSGA